MCSRTVEGAKPICTGTRWLPTSVTSKIVDGTKGAVITTKSGESLAILPKSFVGSKDVVIAVYDDVVLEQLVFPMVQSGPVAKFSPEDLKFAFSATLSLRYFVKKGNTSNITQNEVPGYHYIVHYLSPETKQWEPVGGESDEETGLVRVGITHFSAYVVMRVPLPNAVTVTGDPSMVFKTTTIIAIAVGGAALLLCFAVVYYRFCTRKKDLLESQGVPEESVPTTRADASDRDAPVADFVTLNQQNVVPLPAFAHDSSTHQDIFVPQPMEVIPSVSAALFRGAAPIHDTELYHVAADLVTIPIVSARPVAAAALQNLNTNSQLTPMMSAMASMYVEDGMDDEGTNIVSSFVANRLRQCTSASEIAAGAVVGATAGSASASALKLVPQMLPASIAPPFKIRVAASPLPILEPGSLSLLPPSAREIEVIPTGRAAEQFMEAGAAGNMEEKKSEKELKVEMAEKKPEKTIFRM